ncbi:unnamed protein product [Nippostrongylus brasiliensis]|uniref:ANK_REP_REGION domain-containing protein n=1 Tax=Nippostrongylus brasiliensis TaxID=27835 RepID=A0A0N4Y5W6_NIPBR|nr:unnamed protein product [Nippostrongylus brasiliensis]
MLPETSKEKKKADHEEKDNVKKNDKRRNSLTDSATFSSSTSSNSSSVDSDEAVSWPGNLCDSKGTMTMPMETVVNTDEHNNTKTDLDKNGFSSEKDQSTSTENVKTVIQTKKRIEKLRKEREKKDKKERERAAAAKKEVENFEANRQSAIFEIEKERCVREMLPQIACARLSKSPLYSDLVGARKENWREGYQDSYLREHNHIGALYIEKDALEGVAHSMELVAAMTNSTYSNKWLRKTLALVLRGKVRKVWRRIQIVAEIMRTHRCHNNRFKTMSLAQVLEHVMESVVNLTRDSEDKTNVAMYLSSQFAGRQPCLLAKHRQCLMLDLILSCLAPTDAGALLIEKTRNCQRQAVHFAAISGQPCQLDVLLKHGSPTNEFDKSKQAAIHYLVERNNVLMVRQLMWYGSDMSLVEPSVSKVPSELYNVDNGEVCSYLQTRVKALERVMATWLKAICAGKLQLGSAASSLHAIRFLPSGGSEINRANDPRRLWLGLRSDIIQQGFNEGDSLVLFMLPVAFTPQDTLMPAEFPHIVRTELFEASFDTFRKAVSLMKAPTLCVSADQLISKVYLTMPVFQEEDNGYVYAWRIPCKSQQLKGVEFAALHCTLNTSQMDPKVAKQAMLFVQIFVVKTPHLGPAARSKQKME